MDFLFILTHFRLLEYDVIANILSFSTERRFHMNNKRCLGDISVGDRVIIGTLNTTGSMRRRLLDIGLIEGTEVECVGRSPCGDPSAYLIRGAVIAIRSDDCKKIKIKKCL